MSDAKWTPEQLEAITESGRSLLVAAAAGAGKTAVLVERIIRKITRPESLLDIDRLLVVTFTSAAATEMRERIGEAIAAALEKNPESRQLQRQMTLLNKASIMTIHSFCLEVIRNNFHFLDLDPAFRIADETEAALMKAEVLEELFEARYEPENGREPFLQLVECYGGTKDDLLLQEMVLTIYEFVRSHPWPEEWLFNNCEAFNVPVGYNFGKSSWGLILTGIVGLELDGLHRQLMKAVAVAGGAEGLEPYTGTLKDDLGGMEALISSCKCSWDEMYNAFNEFSFKTLARCGKNADKAAQEQVKALRNEVKEKVGNIREQFFSCDTHEIANDLGYLYPLMKTLAGLVIEFGEKYAARKKEKSLLDFNDLEHFCLEILTEVDSENGERFDEGFPPISPSKAALALRERYDEILIDEYQDSNLIQEVILTSISKKATSNPNVFMVGDVKQSIYRFRQARPELFLDKYQAFPLESGFCARKIQLFKNFRSREEVINAVNCVFKQAMSKLTGEIEYDASEALNPGAVYEPSGSDRKITGGPVELHILDLADENTELGQSDEQVANKFSEQRTGMPNLKEAACSSSETSLTDENTDVDDGNSNRIVEEEQPDNIQLEARLVVNRIRELMKPDVNSRTFNIYDRGRKEYRPVEYRDIVILLRTTRNWSEIFMDELTAGGIPAYADTGTGYFSTIEVQTILSLLQIIDNPMQDIPLLSVLRSPIAAFTAEELIDIRLEDKENTLFEAMQKLASNEEHKTAVKVRDFLDRLKAWRDKSAYLPVDELIWYLYSDTGYFSYTGAMPGGVQRQANLRILFERARKYQETSYKGLFNFINFIGKLRSGSGDMGSAKILGENENVVRIMSIHKSKGLEFPVVIAAGCGKRFNMQDLNRSILLHQDLGFGPELVDSARRLSYSTLAKQAIRQKIRLETLSEEMRILYVAFTRAREKLIITGTAKNFAKSAINWGDAASTKEMKLPGYTMLKALSYLDWIVPAVMRHKDGVVLRQACLGWDMSDNCLMDDPSIWEVKLWSKTMLSGRIAISPVADSIPSMEDGTSRTSDNAAANSEGTVSAVVSTDIKENSASEVGGGTDIDWCAEIDRRLGWQYNWQLASQIPTKVSVTEVKKRFEIQDNEDFQPVSLYMQPLIKRPAFMAEAKEPGAAEKGTILHFIMQHIDLDRIKASISNAALQALEKDIQEQMEAMVGRELLTEQQVKFVDPKRIVNFFRSTLGKRLLAATGVMREIPFNLELKCTEVYKELPPEIYDDEKVLMQGVIDCCFEEKGSLVVLDYKTDYIPPEGTDLLKERYRLQLVYYARALERITRKKVSGRYIYLFGNGSVIEYTQEAIEIHKK